MSDQRRGSFSSSRRFRNAHVRELSRARSACAGWPDRVETGGDGGRTGPARPRGGSMLGPAGAGRVAACGCHRSARHSRPDRGGPRSHLAVHPPDTDHLHAAGRTGPRSRGRAEARTAAAHGLVQGPRRVQPRARRRVRARGRPDRSVRRQPRRRSGLCGPAVGAPGRGVRAVDQSADEARSHRLVRGVGHRDRWPVRRCPGRGHCPPGRDRRADGASRSSTPTSSPGRGRWQPRSTTSSTATTRWWSRRVAVASRPGRPRGCATRAG